MRDCSRCALGLVVSLLVLSACTDFQDTGGPYYGGGAAGSPSVASIQSPLEQPASVSLTISSDTSVRQSNPNINFGTTPTLDINRGLVKVEPAALTGAVGPTDYVVSAALRFTLVPDGSRRAQRNVGAYRVLKSWTENQATWQCAVDTNTGNRRADCSGTTAWTMTGNIDAFVTTATATSVIPASRTGTVNIDVTNDIRAFLSGTANFGWLLKTNVGNGSEVADLASRESGTPPQLVLNLSRCNATLCDDMNACTVDSCNATGMCVNTTAPAGTTCNDGNACTINDQCSANGCSARAPAPVGTACGSGLICNAMSQCVAAPPPPAMVVINEVDSNSPTMEADFVELYNQGSTVADISGWSIRDNEDTATHIFVIPAGTTIPAGGYVTFSEQVGQLTFGLGGADSARLFDASTTLKDTYSWTAHATTSYGRCPNGTGEFTTTGAPTKGAANNCAPVMPVPAQVVINEIESQPRTGEQDFVELFNAGTGAADVSGWTIKDNNDASGFTIPAGTTIPAGGYLVYGELAGQLTFGLGGSDSVRLFDATAALRETYTWTAHAPQTYGRCPNGTGAFTPTTNATRGVANDCGSGPTFTEWPGSQGVVTADNMGTWSSNLSGLTYQPAMASTPAILWAVENGPSMIFRLEKSGSVWVNSTADGWNAGKTLLYPNGMGMPDSEGVTKPEWDSPFVYVATERDNGANTISRLSILRYDTSALGTTLTATHEWNLTATLPVVGPNLGLEAITYIPDAYLVQAGLRDESTNQPYNPSAYPDHGTGLFFVGVEANGMIHGYALNHANSTFTRIASFSSGMPGVMGLEFDRDQDTLYAYCDNTCLNRATLLAVQDNPMAANPGSFYVGKYYSRPTGLPESMNNESIAIAPESECNAMGQKSVFFTDDGSTGGFSLRVGSINCGSLF